MRIPTDNAAPEEFADRIVPLISRLEDECEMVFAVPVDVDRRTSDAECFVSSDKPRATLPIEELFHLASSRGEPGVMVVSKAAGDLDDLHVADVAFTECLVAAGRNLGIDVVDHVIVKSGRSRSLRETTDFWG